jgi:hypothetical protein
VARRDRGRRAGGFAGGAAPFQRHAARRFANLVRFGRIDIATIRTMKQYVRARDASRAFFAQWLTHLARRGRMTPQRRLLIGITEGDVEGTRRLRQALGAKDALRGAREPDDG